MYFKKTHEWVEIVLWIGVVLTVLSLGYALWYQYVDLTVASLAIMLAFLFLLGYLKYTQVMAIRKKFVIVQETFTTLMLVYFSYAYFSGSQTLPGEKAIDGARKKFDDVYEKSRYQLTMPLVMTALKTFGEIKNIKNIIMSEVKNFSSSSGFNLDNAESITKEIGKLVDKIGQLSDIVGKGFSSKKSFKEIMTEKPEEAARTTKTVAAKNKTRSRVREKKTTK